jgi:Zn-dependent protease
LTLNPLAHLDPIGSLLLIVAGFGWAKPVPINPYALSRRSPAAVMLVSLAGPASNFLMAIMAAIPFRVGLVSITDLFNQPVNPDPTLLQRILPSFPEFLYTFIAINLLLMLFNLIPLAPLDGDKIFDYFVPPSFSRTWERIRSYGPMILLAIVFLLPIVNINVIEWIIGPPMRLLLGALLG